MWNNLIIKALDPRPLLLAGSGWKTTIRFFFETMEPYLSSPQREIITFVPDIDCAVTSIAEN